MPTPTAILLGGNKLNRGILDRLHGLGLRVLVIDWNRQPDLPGDLHLQLDVKDTDRVLAALVSQADLDVRLAYTSIDLAVPTQTAIHERQGLAAPDGAAVRRTLSKASMTDAWRRDQLLHRFSSLIDEVPGDQLAQVVRLPLIIKPNVSSSSRGITILPRHADSRQIHDAVERAREASADERVLVEEFVQGQEFTVEMLGDRQGHVAVYAISAKYHTEHAGANKVAVKLHYNPPAYSETTLARIADYARRCYRSLGLTSSMGHLEIIMKECGTLCPLEMGARSSGFIASHLVDASSGRDYLRDYIHVLDGGAVPNGFHRSANASMYFFYDFPPGFPCRQKTHLVAHLPSAIRSLYHDRDAIQVGSVFRGITNDNERHGYEILCGRREELTLAVVEHAEGRMLQTLFGTTSSTHLAHLGLAG
jgi:hypothetical protein